jgi:hypothetical protein
MSVLSAPKERTMGNKASHPPKLRDKLELEDKKLARILEKTILDDDASTLENLYFGSNLHVICPKVEYGEDGFGMLGKFTNTTLMLFFAIENGKVKSSKFLANYLAPEAFESTVFPDLKLIDLANRCMEKFDDEELIARLAFIQRQRTGDIYSHPSVCIPLVLSAIDYCCPNSFRGAFKSRKWDKEYKLKFLERIAEIGYKPAFYEMVLVIIEKCIEEKTSGDGICCPNREDVHQLAFDHANDGMLEFLVSNYSNIEPPTLPIPLNWKKICSFKNHFIQGEFKEAIELVKEDPTIIEHPNKECKLFFYITERLPKDNILVQCMLESISLPQPVKNKINSSLPNQIESKE